MSANKSTKPELQGLNLVHQFLQTRFGISKQHSALRVEEQFVFDTRITGFHTSFQYDDLLGLIYIQNRHAVNGAGWISFAAGLTTSFAPTTKTTSVVANSGLMCSISINLS